MANQFDRDNCIKLFRLDDSRDSTYPENAVVIPAGTNVFQSIFRSEFRGRLPPPTMETDGPSDVPDDGVKLLVKFRHELDELFQDCGDISGIAAVLWEDISRRLFERGFDLSGKQCAAVWEAVHSEYLKVVNTDDETRVSEFRHFAAFEELYKLRSKYIDSKIVEDITEYLSSRPDCQCTNDKTGNEKNSPSQSSRKALSRDEFSSFSNEEDSQMLIEAIAAAQSMLEENLKHSDYQTSSGDVRVDINQAEKSPWRKKKSKKLGGKRCAVEEGTSSSLKIRENKTDSESTMLSQSESTNREVAVLGCPVYVRSEKNEFYWDTDATQCFLDLRLYVESNKQTKLSVMRMYKTTARFVSQKMLQNGFKVSEDDCNKKWKQMMRYYGKEVQKMRDIAPTTSRPQALRTYFWQMDQVLKKSGLETGGNNVPEFVWDQESIRALIVIRIPMENAFSMFKRYVILWQYVAAQMMKRNFSPTYNECSLKWMEICEIYRICVDSVKRGAKEEDISWNFYQDMRQGFKLLNAESNKVAINYQCRIGTGVEDKSTQCLATCSTSSLTKSETREETEFETLSRIENLNTENGADYSSLETEAGPSTLNIAIQHCNALENILKGVEDESKAADPKKIDNSVEIITLGDLYSLDNEGNLEVRPESPRLIQAQGTPLLKFGDAFKGKKQFEQSYNSFREPATECKRIEATTCEEERILIRWTEEATAFLIKFRISRELKFRSRLHLETDLWKEIALDMQSAGHNVSHESCSARWSQLMEAYRGNPSPENRGIISPKFHEQLKLLELPFARNNIAAKPSKTGKNVNDTSSKSVEKFDWTESAVRCLIEFKFSKQLRNERLYGAPIAAKMQSAGYSTITPAEVSKKWARLYASYKKSLSRKKIGREVVWKYFELIDSHVKGFTGNKKAETQNNVPPFTWTPKAVQKLIDLRLMLEDFCHMIDHKSLIIMWKKLADQMNIAGFLVTYHECATEWQFLVNAYMKTKQELRTGNGAVIGKYFIMMDKALNQLNSQDRNVEKPIDFSIPTKKRKLDDTCQDNLDNVDRSFGTLSFNETKNASFCENVHQNEGQSKSIDENGMDLALETTDPHSSCALVHSSIKIEELPDVNCTCVSSNVDSSLVYSHNEEKDIPSIMMSVSDKSQQEVCESLEKVIMNNDHVDGSKENLVSTGRETRSKISSRENIRQRILCDKKAWNEMPSECDLPAQNPLTNYRVLAPRMRNLLSKGRAENPGENTEGNELTGRWSEAGTHALIDLRLEHDQNFVTWPEAEIEWEKVAAQLLNLGYDYGSQECRERWYSLKMIYEQQIADIQANGTAQAWPYFWKMDSFHKKLANLYQGFRYILPTKRPHEEELLNSPKKLALSSIVEPLERVVGKNGNVG